MVRSFVEMHPETYQAMVFARLRDFSPAVPHTKRLLQEQ